MYWFKNYCEELALPESALPTDAVLCAAREGCHEELMREAEARVAFAKDVMTGRELASFRSMSAVASREAEWLLGRCVAKRAVGLWMRRSQRIAVSSTEVEIRADERGKPFAAGDWLARVPQGVSISITHSRGDAVAVAWGAEHGAAGIDLEFPREMSDALVERSFSEAELARAGGRSRALELWCLKEAAAKATGDGIFKGLSELDVVSHSEVRGAGRTFSTLLLRRGDGHLALACLRQ